MPSGLISSGCKLALSPLVNATQAVNRWADRSYPGAITWALAHPGRVIGSAIAVFVLTMVLVLPRLGTELIPQMSQGEFNVDLRLPPGTPLEQTDRSVQAAQRASDSLGNVALAYSVAGTGNRLDANPVDAGENTGRLSITLQSGAGREDEEAAITGTSSPSCCRIAPSIFAALRAGAPAAAPNTALPLLSRVRTSTAPRPASSARRSAIGTRCRPPTLTPRSKATHRELVFKILPSLPMAPAADGGCGRGGPPHRVRKLSAPDRRA